MEFDSFRNRSRKISSFAVEAYPRGPSFNDGPPEERVCRKNSDEQLRPLVGICFGNAIFRELTNEEQIQMQQYKEEQKGKQSKVNKLIAFISVLIS